MAQTAHSAGACCDKTKTKHTANQCQTLQLNQVQTNANPIFIKHANQCQTWCKPETNLVLLLGKL